MGIVLDKASGIRFPRLVLSTMMNPPCSTAKSISDRLDRRTLKSQALV